MKLIGLALVLALATQDRKDPDAVKVSADFEDTAIGEVLDSLKGITGIPIEIDDSAKKKLDGSARITVKVQDLTLTSAVKLIVMGHGLDVTAVDKKKLVISAPKGK